MNLFKIFINFWKMADFSDWKESDIREDFIKPLLDLLGYKKDSIDGGIEREKSLQLNKNFLRVGRKRVELDYVPTYKCKEFWIIEAKPGRELIMDEGDLYQAYLYAIHPEIQAKYIVLINGHEIRLFDVNQAIIMSDAILISNSSNCEQTLPKLIQLLSAKTYLQNSYNRIIKEIDSLFTVEIDVRRRDKFLLNLKKLPSNSRSNIEKNRAHYMVQNVDENRRIIEKMGKYVSLNTLLNILNSPFEKREPIKEIVRRLKENNEEEKKELLHVLKLEFEQYLKFSNFRSSIIWIYSLVMKEYANRIEGTFLKTVLADFNELVQKNLKYWNHDGKHYVIRHIENLVLRNSKNFALRVFLDRAIETEKELEKVKPLEERINDSDFHPSYLIGDMTIISNILWKDLEQINEIEDLWDYYFLLLTFEDAIFKLPYKEYKKGKGDMTFFELYGTQFDNCLFGTYSIINKINPGIIPHLNSDLQNILGTPRDKLPTKIPKPKQKPDNWSINEEKFGKTMAFRLLAMVLKRLNSLAE